MQTKNQIRQLLESVGIEPNKRLGQHFLIDLNLMRLLVDSADIQNNDIVLEVGCGTGSLTEALVERAGRVIAVEIDKNLFDILQEQLGQNENLDLINGDVLKSKHTISQHIIDAILLVREKFSGRILLVANLPYNIACPLMINLVTGPMIADAMFVTVQKEVADRMTAETGSENYGILSILLRATGDVEMIKILKPSVFWPRPQVDSAMVRFVRNREKSGRVVNMDLFTEIVHHFFAHRRKTLLSSSKMFHGRLEKIQKWPEIFEKCSINPALRPEQISPDDFIAIASFIKL
jgi:16S rRNA (adenine1518-N6/adenine1519-N6)-dimethyltransferase